MNKVWQIRSQQPEDTARLTEALGCHPVTAAVLVNRGLFDPDNAERFLHPSPAQIRSPFLMKDMEQAVSRIITAIKGRESILVFGDYDADGITATALLLGFLADAGAQVRYHIPNRLTEGYGLTTEALRRYATSRDVDLIVTVDCGVSSHSAVEAARQAGIDVIITDHHEPPAKLPKALALINPKQAGCRSGFQWLAGVGVAFNLVLALRKRLRETGFWGTSPEPNLKSACDLVALGTVADMVPLIEENRVFVREGLQVLSDSPRPGMRALLDVAGTTNGVLDAWDLAFRLAPRLNASGRLGDPSAGCRLLITDSQEEACRISRDLDKQNTVRKEIEFDTFDAIMGHLEDFPEAAENAIVLDHADWHEGVIGIVASRLAQRFFRPVVLIAVRDGTGKGSARSPEGFNLFDAMSRCSEHLDRFGGHEAAAGLSLPAKNIASFRKQFQETASAMMRQSPLVPVLRIDTTIRPEEVSSGLVDELEQLAPFGAGNPEPLFALEDLQVLSFQRIGNGHVKMRLAANDSTRATPIDAILFNAPFQDAPPKHFQRVACHLRWNRWMEQKNLQAVIKDFT